MLQLQIYLSQGAFNQKMNIQQIQITRQKVAALLVAGSILAASAGLAWAGINVGSSTTQSGPLVQDCAYLPHPGQGGPSVGQVDCSEADFLESESRLLPWSQRRSVKGRAAGASGTNF